jgi:signal recognition particle GTPase
MIKTQFIRYKWHIIAVATVLLIILIFSLANSNSRLNRKYEALEKQLNQSRAVTIHLQGQLIDKDVLLSTFNRQLDSLNSLIENDNKKRETLNKQKNEKISKIPNMSASDRQRWFDNNYPRTGN